MKQLSDLKDLIIDWFLPVMEWVIAHWVLTLIILFLLVFWAVRNYRQA